MTALFFSLNLFQTKSQLAALEISYEGLNYLNQFGAQLSIAHHWLKISAPTLFIAAIFGYITAWIYAKYVDIKRMKRLSGNGKFRGITCTLGTLPKPKTTNFNPISIELPNNIKLSKEHKKLLDDILSLINTHEVPAGVGHSDLNLLQHSINTIEKAIKINKTEQNLICAIAAHDIGKIKTFKKVEDKWIVEGKHDDEGAKLIRELESWWMLSEKDRFTILYAVKYSHKPTLVPKKIPHREEIVKCIEGIRHIDHNVTRVEKEETVVKLEEETTLYEYFLKFLQVAPFRSPSSPAGTKSGGWIKKNHCFLLESYFKDVYLKENHPEVLAAYNELGKKKDNSRVSRELLKQLNAKEMLVKEWDGEKIGDPTQALWAIQCGSSTFIKVIIIPLTEEIHNLVGDQKYHQPLNVISSFSKYRKAQKQLHAEGKPQAKASPQKNNKIAEDLKKMKQAKMDAEQKNKDEVKTNASDQPEAKVKTKDKNTKDEQKIKKTNSEQVSQNATDKMFASFAIGETKDATDEEKETSNSSDKKKSAKEKGKTEITVKKPPTPPQENLSNLNETKLKTETFRENLGIREIDDSDSVI